MYTGVKSHTPRRRRGCEAILAISILKEDFLEGGPSGTNDLEKTSSFSGKRCAI